MKITGEVFFQGGTDADRTVSGRKSFFAGNIRPDSQDNDFMIERKRRLAKQQALKIINDAYASDSRITDDSAARHAEVEELTYANKELKENVSSMEQERENLKISYGISEESEEQADLELLEKRYQYKKEHRLSELTDEELKRLNELDNGAMTEYQRQSMDILENEEAYIIQIQDNESVITGDLSAVRSNEEARIKSNTIVKAVDSADEVMTAAGREIMGMMMQDAMEHVDEKLEETVEKAEEAAENKEEQEELIESVKAKKEAVSENIEEIREAVKEADSQISSDDVTKEMLDGSPAVQDIHREIKEMLERLRLIDDDIKGSAVDRLL